MEWMKSMEAKTNISVTLPNIWARPLEFNSSEEIMIAFDNILKEEKSNAKFAYRSVHWIIEYPLWNSNDNLWNET